MNSEATETWWLFSINIYTTIDIFMDQGIDLAIHACIVLLMRCKHSDTPETVRAKPTKYGTEVPQAHAWPDVPG